MDVENLKQASLDFVREQYLKYLHSLNLGPNTVSTMFSDSFYLWRKKGKEYFWSVVTSDNFEEDARLAISSALSENSSGNISDLVNPYVSVLRRFRSFIYSDSQVDFTDEASEALRNFLLDIDCLDPLSEWTNKFNLFDVLKISKTEIRHSNMLAWLINPNENHGLGDSVLNGFIQYGVVNGMAEEEVFDVLLMDLHEFEIRREWNNIDLLAISQKHGFVMCVENKIDSSEHDNQLEKYSKTIDNYFPGYKKMYIYLSPEGTESSNPDLWCSMGYQDVIDIIEKAKAKYQLLPEVELLIKNYVETIRRVIVGDEKLARICAEIYAKHQKALDLIYENRPDRASEVAQLFREWAIQKTSEKLIHVNLDKCVKTYTRFTTDGMTKVLPPSENSVGGWNSPDHYFYELFNNQGKDFWIQFVICSKNLTEDERLTCDKINQFSPSKQQKENWQWRTHYSTRHVKLEETISKEKVFDQLDRLLKDIKDYESRLFSDIL